MVGQLFIIDCNNHNDWFNIRIESIYLFLHFFHSFSLFSNVFVKELYEFLIYEWVILSFRLHILWLIFQLYYEIISEVLEAEISWATAYQDWKLIFFYHYFLLLQNFNHRNVLYYILRITILIKGNWLSTCWAFPWPFNDTLSTIFAYCMPALQNHWNILSSCCQGFRAYLAFAYIWLIHFTFLLLYYYYLKTY